MLNEIYGYLIMLDILVFEIRYISDENVAFDWVLSVQEVVTHFKVAT